ncbi:MAG: MFS transporter, partial [Chloroflexi bacterium]|nr:MFS transporter [Chloroflexota bacterium]
MAPNVRPFLARLVRRLTNVDATDHATPEQQQGMRMLWLDGILASASTAFYAEFVVLYMLALGASATVIGLRASINGAAALAAPMIGAYLVARSGARKRWVLWGPGGVSRLALLAMAAVPLVFRGPAAVWGFVALLSLQAFASAVGMPAHHSLLGDVVPLPIRGRFMGAGMMFNSIAAVLVLPVAGFLVARIGGLSGYQVLWLLAALAGLGATAMYWRIPEPPSEEGAATQGGPLGGLREAWGSLRGNRPFLLFCGINFLWTVGINISGPFFTVHMVEGLGFSADTIAYLATFTTLFNVVALRLAGGLVDRHGAPKMTAIAMLLVPLMPLLWVFASTPVHIG